MTFLLFFYNFFIELTILPFQCICLVLFYFVLFYHRRNIRSMLLRIVTLYVFFISYFICFVFLYNCINTQGAANILGNLDIGALLQSASRILGLIRQFCPQLSEVITKKNTQKLPFWIIQTSLSLEVSVLNKTTNQSVNSFSNFQLKKIFY